MSEDAQPQAAQGAPPPNPTAKKESRREFFEAIFFALALALFIRTFVVQAFKIPSGSMIPTLLVGDHILVNKFIYGIPIPFTGRKLVQFKDPARGEVIVFKYPKDPSKDFIKRVVGLPGDTVEMREGVLLVNGEPVPMIEKGDYAYQEASEAEPLANKLYEETLGDVQHPIIYAADMIPSYRSFERATVPPGQIFVMGDNRDRSNDSRFWGFVDIEAIQGRAIAIYWSWDGENVSLRWRRLGDLIH